MPNLNTIIMFISASTILGFSPGPDNIFVLSQAMLHGKNAGLQITLGLCTGLIFHTTIVAIGIAAIFKTSFTLFNILKIAGSVYLLYLSWLTIRASLNKIKINNTNKLTPVQLYKRGIIMNITNPKVSIFFIAFLPQFTDPMRGRITLQLISLGIIFIIVSLIVFSIISLLAGIISEKFLKSQKAIKILNITAGILYLILAIKLIFTNHD